MRLEHDATMEAFRHRWLGVAPQDYERMTQEMAAFLALIDAPLLAVARGRVLELGCGTGRVLAQLATRTQAIGIDVAPRMLELAAQRGHTVIRATAEALPFRDGCFDTVVCAFYTMRDLDRPVVYAEAARVLRPGGVLAFSLRSYYPVYLETLWRRFLRRGRLPSSWKTLDGADGVEHNLRDVASERAELERAGLRLRELSGLRLIPFLRRWLPRVHPGGYWRGRAAALGTDLFFVAERP
jgi:SAM-dependent methyltransferase